MFNRARIKLTAWYLLIIMIISISFSAAIFKVLTFEFGRVERLQRYRIEHGLSDRLRIFSPPSAPPDVSPYTLLDPDLVSETKNRFILILSLINVFILAGSAVAGYFLAGMTLNPISEMIEEQNRFITDASHELRTPLTSLKSEIEVNLRDKKLTLSSAKKLMESNLEEVNNLQVLSDDLIKLTQYQKGNNGFPFSRVEISLIVEEAIKKIISLAKSKNIAIVNKIENFVLEGDKQTLVELFIILLDNAVKYSANGSVITLTAEKTDGHALIHVADQGIGIDEKDLPFLFDRFYRADKSRTKSDIRGYGLGLSIAKEIVAKHHGSISVQSQPKLGSTFTIELPIKHQTG